MLSCTLGGIRTRNPTLRRRVLYPVELQGQRFGAGGGDRTHICLSDKQGPKPCAFTSMFRHSRVCRCSADGGGRTRTGSYPHQPLRLACLPKFHHVGLIVLGGTRQSRTADLSRFRRALFQLSYRTVKLWSQRGESNSHEPFGSPTFEIGAYTGSATLGAG